MLRLATPADLPELARLAERMLNESNYSVFPFSAERFNAMVAPLITH